MQTKTKVSLKSRIRQELDKGSGYNFDEVVETIISEGVSDDELREILPDIVKFVAKQRSVGGFMSATTSAPVKPTSTSSTQSLDLLPKAVPLISTVSDKVKGYQASKLDEIYPVGGGQYKKLSEMNREDIRFNVRMLEGRVQALNGRIKGWTKLLDQMHSYNVNVVEELPEEVKEKI